MSERHCEGPAGLLVVISGPSGVGKGAISRALLERESNMRFSISVTTRERRPNEREGVNYFFRTPEQFDAMVREEAFLEYTRVFGADWYGTPRAFVERQTGEGRDVILEIDVIGAQNVKRLYPEAVTVFIAPPSLTELRNRLTRRGTETREALERRFETAREELRILTHYDYLVVNDVLEQAIREVQAIILAEKRRICRSAYLFDKYLGGTDL